MLFIDKNNQGYKRTLFNNTKQYNIHIFDKIFFFKYKTSQIKTTETNMKVTCLN